MKVLQINAVPYGSTGKIMFSLADVIKENAGEVLCTSGFSWKTSDREDYFLTSGIIEKTIHMFMAKITGYNGCFSWGSTVRLLKKINQFKPNIIHLHNIHGWFVNIPMLFRYLKKHPEIKVIWTFHDCWPVTGQCPYFTLVGCNKWQERCYGCVQYRKYPDSYVDKSQKMHDLKKKWFMNMPNMIIVTPSQWLKSIVKQSFLRNYDVRVVNNGINLNIFSEKENCIRKQYNLENKFVLLGVAYAWDKRKGIDVFIELAERLPEQYVIILVGTDDKIDKILPANIISIHRTQDQNELAEIYTAADLFVNPTKEENYPTVHLESLACGTPVVTFNTGGAAEMLNEKCGSVIDYGDIDMMEKEIYFRCEEKPFLREDCVRQAQNFNEKNRYKEYLDLYRSVL